ncbi:NfeD family protein [Marinobacter sp. X15-166B]|uniref:NfeD family protein n=1 Tax=Marinobacter sp. X15-166B TaxID=1897620 RepID=UPI00114CC9AB|nr:hypothetical protein [Marinobacter sp. X15-166B]
MIELSLSWWLLVSLGVALVIAEMFIGTFVVLWFGIGAILTGLLTLMMPDLNLGLQLLLSTLVGAVLMFLLRSRYLTPGNAESDAMHTFTATEGRLHLGSNGTYSVFANGTYWGIQNIDAIDPEARVEGATVSITAFVNNQAVLREKPTP